MSRKELQILLNETRDNIRALIKAGDIREAAFAMDALVQIQADLIKALLNEIKERE